jgi:hypothetical protein
MGPDEDPSWLRNMPDEEEAGWGANELNSVELEELTNALPQPALTPTPEVALANTVAEVDRAIGGWKSARSQVIVHRPEGGITRLTKPDGTLASALAGQPAREGLALDRRASSVEHILVINRQAQHIGWSNWANNQFLALAVPPQPPTATDDPSEVGPNA